MKIKFGRDSYILVDLPKTVTILVMGFMLGNLLFVPMIALVGKMIQPEYRDTVNSIAGLFKDGMLLILGAYFRDKMITMENVNGEQGNAKNSSGAA